MIMHSFFANHLLNLEEIHTDIRNAIKGLPQEALDWIPGPGMNSMTILVAHLTGAERYWIGDVVASEPSGRDRQAEFKVQGLSEEDLLVKLGEANRYARQALEKLSIQALEEKRISARNGRQVTVGWALCHSLQHTALHAGHMQITRQLWEGQQSSIKVVI
jgi:uncharacterized damage-inducible protein DinB